MFVSDFGFLKTGGADGATENELAGALSFESDFNHVVAVSRKFQLIQMKEGTMQVRCDLEGAATSSLIVSSRMWGENHPRAHSQALKPQCNKSTGKLVF